MDANLRVVVGKEDSGLKELLESLGKLQSLFGGAIPAAVSKGAVAMKQSHAQVVESVKQGNTQIAQSVAQTAEKNKGRTIAELQEELALRDKSKKQIVQLQTSLAEDVKNIARQVTMTLDAEEKKRLQNTQKELKSELAAVKEEAEKRGIESKKGAGFNQERELTGKGVLQVAGIGAAFEAFKMVKEHAAEANAVMSQLQASTGLEGEALERAAKQGEELGKQYKIGGDAGKQAMAVVGSYTHATGEDLKRQTEDTIILAQKMHVSTEAAAKMLGKASDPEIAGNMAKLGIQLDANATAEQRAAAIHMAAMNAKKGVDEANKDASTNLNEVMMEVQQTIGELAATTLQNLMPAIEAVTPVIKTAGEITGSILKPVMASLSPMFADIGKVINQLAPIIGDLLGNALQAVAPLLDVVGTLLQAFLPILPPIVQLVSVLLTPALKLLASVLQFVSSAALKPLIELLGGALTKALEAVTGLISKTVGAISSVVSAVGSVLGLTASKAEAATKEGGAKVVAAQDETNKKLEAQAAAFGKGDLNQLKAAISAKRLTEAQEAEYRQKAIDAHNQTALDLLKKWDEQKSKAGVTAAKKDAKAVLDAKKAALDQELADKKDEIAAEDITDKQAKALLRNAEIKHLTDIRDIYKDGSKEYIAANRKLQALLLADKKQDRADALSEAKAATDVLIGEFNTRADRELLSDQQRADGLYKIELDGLTKRLALVQKGSQEESALLKEKAALEAKHFKDTRTQQIALNKEVEQDNLALRKAEIDEMKAHGVDRRTIQAAETKLSIDEENARWKEEQEKRGADMKANNALRESLEQNHQNKLKAIETQAAAERKQIWMQNMQLLAGPITKGIMGGITQMTAGVHKLTQSWQQSGGVLGSIFGGILDSFVTMIEGMIEKIVAMEAILLVANLIPGFSAFMDMFQSFTSAIPTQATGLATGGVLKGATVMGAGVLTRPTFLASGGTMPIVAGEIPNEAVIPLNAYPGAKAMMQGDLGFSEHADRIITAIQNSGQNVAMAAGRTKYGIPINDPWRSVVNISSKAEDRRSF